MDRRSFLRLIAAGLVSQAVDTEKLLWIPGEKKIFLPSGIHRLSASEIAMIEFERIASKLPNLFERDNIFYQAIKAGNVTSVRGPFKIPLIIGDDND